VAKSKSKEISIPLSVPIEHGSETIAELVLQRPKAKHFRGMPVENQTMDDMFTLIAKLSGQPPSVIDELDTADLEEVSKRLEGFMPRGRGTGKTRSR
jgi:uncharacterized NAD-dependent epimerase/dehydratase family protein